MIVAKLQAKSAVRKAAPKPGRRGTVPYYNQTTDFSCGPSSLLMAMKALDPKSDFSRTHELQLWREANTIFMCCVDVSTLRARLVCTLVSSAVTGT